MRSARAISSWSSKLALAGVVLVTCAGAPSVSTGSGPEGIPAIARKGNVVLVEVSHASGGAPGGQDIELRDRKDRVLQTITLQSQREAIAMMDGKGPDLEKRFEGVNKKLTALHDKYDFVPMTALEVQVPDDGGYERLVVGDGLDVEWKDNHVLVHPHGETKVLAKAGDRSWLAKDTRGDGGMCSHPVRLRGAYHATGINTVVVDIEYHGTDSCWEPSGQWHVVSW